MVTFRKKTRFLVIRQFPWRAARHSKRVVSVGLRYECAACRRRAAPRPGACASPRRRPCGWGQPRCQRRTFLRAVTGHPQQPRSLSLTSRVSPTQDLIENVVAVAENTADELARSDGRDVQLQEDPDLQLPFLLPEDGYSCDVVRNIPSGLQEFLDPLCQRGGCNPELPLTQGRLAWDFA